MSTSRLATGPVRCVPTPSGQPRRGRLRWPAAGWRLGGCGRRCRAALPGCRGKTSISTEGRPGIARPFSTQQAPAAPVSSRCPSVAEDTHASLKIKYALTSTFAVELRGLEPLTSSMPWWPGKRRRRAGSVDRVQGRAGAVTPIQPGGPSVCPPSLKRPAIADLSPQCRSISSVGLDHTSVRVHAGSCGAWHTLTAHRRRPSPR